MLCLFESCLWTQKKCEATDTRELETVSRDISKLPPWVKRDFHDAFADI